VPVYVVPFMILVYQENGTLERPMCLQLIEL